MPRGFAENSVLSRHFGKMVVGAIFVSFGLGVFFFLTIAQQRSGDPIPDDAAPSYFVEDAAR